MFKQAGIYKNLNKHKGFFSKPCSAVARRVLHPSRVVLPSPWSLSSPPCSAPGPSNSVPCLAHGPSCREDLSPSGWFGHFWERFEALSSSFLSTWNATSQRDAGDIWEKSWSPPTQQDQRCLAFLLRIWKDLSSLQQTNSEERCENWLSLWSENNFWATGSTGFGGWLEEKGNKEEALVLGLGTKGLRICFANFHLQVKISSAWIIENTGLLQMAVCSRTEFFEVLAKGPCEKCWKLQYQCFRKGLFISKYQITMLSSYEALFSK